MTTSLYVLRVPSLCWIVTVPIAPAVAVLNATPAVNAESVASAAPATRKNRSAIQISFRASPRNLLEAQWKVLRPCSPYCKPAHGRLGFRPEFKAFFIRGD